MTADSLIQLGVLISAIVFGFITMSRDIKKSNINTVKEIFTDKINDFKQYMELKNKVEQLDARVDLLDKYASEDKLEHHEQFEKIQESLAELHDKINKHFQDYHSRKEN